MQVDKPSNGGTKSSSNKSHQQPQPTTSTKPAKRKAQRGRKDSDDDDSDEEMKDSDEQEMLDVSFSFFDPQPQDYHSIKLLLSQLFQGDSSVLDLGGVTDLVLEQKLVGSTVKTDTGEGENDDTASQGDPYAVLTILNLNVHKEKPCIQQLITYLLSKIPSSSSFHSLLTSLVATPVEGSTQSSPKHVGLVLNERLINMPVQVVPPMFRMLQEELGWAVEDKEPYHFSHLLFLSRVFLSSSSSFEEDPNAAIEAVQRGGVVVAQPSAGGKKAGGGKKKRKAGNHEMQGEKEEEKTWVYHAEDEFIQRFATETQTFQYTNTTRSSDPSEQQDQFGVDTRGRMMLVPFDKFDEIVEGIEGFIGA